MSDKELGTKKASRVLQRKLAKLSRGIMTVLVQAAPTCRPLLPYFFIFFLNEVLLQAASAE